MAILSRLFGPPSRDDFARLIAQALQAEGYEGTIELDAPAYALRLSGPNGEHVLRLGHLYNDYTKAPAADRDRILAAGVRRFRAATGPAPKHFGEARQSLLPELRRRSSFGFANLAARARGETSDARPFRLMTEELAIGLVLDFADTTRVIDHALLDSWSVGEEEAMQAAVTSLRARTDPQFVEHAPGVWVSAWQDTYDATRLLLADVIASLPVRGRHTALVPHRSLLVVTGDTDDAGLATMVAMAPAAFGQPDAVSVTPLVLTRDGWEELMLDDSHPAARALALPRLRMRTAEYDGQAELLLAAAARSGETRFITPFVGTRDKRTGAFSSYCVWSEGFEQSLPKADRVGFATDRAGYAESLGFADWDDVVRVMGFAMHQTDDYPPRFVVEIFPTEGQLRDMGVGGLAES
jgi:hypothetical protein